MNRPRAIGIVRVSRSSGRSGESFSSPQDQVDHLQALAKRQGWDITIPEPHEIDVSGDALLSDRPQLSRAVVAVQTGQAEIIAGAHTERLWWNHETASQVIRLVEDANGEVWSADQGLLTRRSAADEFSGTVRTAADRLSRRQNAEKSAAALQRAISRGVPPLSRITVGYRKRDDGRIEPDPQLGPIVSSAFELRAAGKTIREVRAHLQSNGITMTYAGVSKLLASRLVIGEIHFGDFTPNLAAHDPIVDRATWEKVQETRVPAGRNTQNPRLLARLGVLRCGTCGARMSANMSTWRSGEKYAVYRCQNEDCTHHVSITAEWAEDAVADAVRHYLAGIRGQASRDDGAAAAEVALELAQDELDAAIRTLSVVGDEPATIQRLSELRAARDAARSEMQRLSGLRAALSVDPSTDWDRITHDERRDFIQAVVFRAVVSPGRGRNRVSVLFFE